MLPFDPLFANPHLQTIASHYWPRPRSQSRWPLQPRLFQTEPGVQVLVQSQVGQPVSPANPASGAGDRLLSPANLVLVHGLEGSGDAGYIRSLAFTALQSGCAVHRFHMRTCGGTEHLCTTLYHAGLTVDLLSVVKQLVSPANPAVARVGQAVSPPNPVAPFILIGFSLGGNVVLKLAGELAERAPSLLQAVVAVSTPLDLAACSRRISGSDNRLYERRFVRRMRARLLATGRYSARDLAGLRSLLAIDDRITGPSFGFSGADHYYRTQSALNFVSAIRVPTLLIQAQDDHFIPFSIFDSTAVRSNPNIELIAPAHGGHIGFLARGPHRFWLDRVILDWIANVG